MRGHHIFAHRKVIKVVFEIAFSGPPGGWEGWVLPQGHSPYKLYGLCAARKGRVFQPFWSQIEYLY